MEATRLFEIALCAFFLGCIFGFWRGHRWGWHDGNLQGYNDALVDARAVIFPIVQKQRDELDELRKAAGL